MNLFPVTVDAIIAGSVHLAVSVIAGSVILCVMKRKIILFTAPLLILAFGFLYLVFYSCFIMPKNIDLNRQTIDLAQYEGEPLQIALISDIHAGWFSNTKTLESAIEKLDEEDDLDAVFILGDLVNSDAEVLDQLDSLQTIASTVPTYAVLGNHDYLRRRINPYSSPEVAGITEKLEDLGITVLKNTCTEMKTDDEDTIYLMGTKDIFFRDPDFSCITTIPENGTIITLSHNPDVARYIEDNSELERSSLIVSGHTHGGEVRIPGIGAIFPVPTDHIPSSYQKGMFTYQGIPLYITSGLGNVATRFRTWNNPEVVILEIK